MSYDLIIRNGLVYDGTGDAARIADIGVRDGKIAKIEPVISEDAREEFDASGKSVTPGFVDVHTHYDGQATWDQHLTPSSNPGHDHCCAAIAVSALRRVVRRIAKLWCN